jgi:hypothetical protein
LHYIDDGPHVGDRSAAKDQKKAANINMHALTSCAGKLNSVVLVCKAIQYLTVTLPYIISIIFLGRSPGFLAQSYQPAASAPSADFRH